MILLLLLTAVSLTSLKAIKTDERLAGNLQDRYVAFQAAESALREAEDFLEQAALPRFENTAGLYLQANGGIPYPFDYDSDNARVYTGSLSGVTNQPLYTIEQMEGGVEQGDSLVIGVRYGGERRASYRITALGFGGSSSTRVVLQSTFRR
jgi:type IV pilus assembly protein PilX